MKVANSTSGEEPWWIEDDETQLCDDNPDLHYGVCEFDTYDGICRHCKNLVHPDIHLIHLIHNDRNNILFFESEMLKSTGYIDGYFEKNWAKTYKSKLSEIWEEFAERDIMFEVQLGYGAARAEAIQQMCYADKEYILSEAEENFPEEDLRVENPEALWFTTMLREELHQHFERIRDWDIERVDWSPEEWRLKKPPIYKDTPQESHVSRAIGVFLLAAYGWYVLEENLLEVFEGTSGSGAEFLIWLFLIPVFVIHKIFFNTPKLEQIITTEGKKITEEVYEQRLKIASGVLIFALIIPWWGFSSGFQALRWSPQDAWFVLTEARLWGLPLLDYFHWQMSTLLPLVFVATFVATWSKTSPRQEFGRKASNFHLLFFAVWYLIGIYQWGNFLPQEWNYAVFIAAASGIGLHPTAYGLAEKFSSRTSE